MNDDQMQARKGEAFRLDVRSRELFARARNTMLRRTVRIISGPDRNTEGQITKVHLGLDGGLVLTVRLASLGHRRQQLPVTAVAIGDPVQPRETMRSRPFARAG